MKLTPAQQIHIGGAAVTLPLDGSRRVFGPITWNGTESTTVVTLSYTSAPN